MSTASIFTFTESHALLPTFIVCDFGYRVSEVARATFLTFLVGNTEPLALLQAGAVLAWGAGGGGRGDGGRAGGRDGPRPGCRPRQASPCLRNWGVTRNICDISLALIKTEISFPAHKTFVLPTTDKDPQRLTQRESGPFRSRVKIQAVLTCVSFHNTELGVRSFILNSKSCRSWWKGIAGNNLQLRLQGLTPDFLLGLIIN